VERWQTAVGNPVGEDAVEFGVGGGGCGVGCFDLDGFVGGAVELAAERAAAFENIGPVEGVPDGFPAYGYFAVLRGMLEEIPQTFGSAYVADPAGLLSGKLFESLCDVGKVSPGADGRARYEEIAVFADIADYGLAVWVEPVLDAWVKDLVCGGVPAVAHHEFAGP
jgi:hypothetical protein